MLQFSTTYKLVLASASPARRELLKKLGLPFECHTSGYEENMNISRSPAKVAKILALEKGRFIAHKFSQSIIISADTFVMIGEEKLGKPRTIEEAGNMIQMSSNQIMKVYTGVALIKVDGHSKIIDEFIDHTVTKVEFAEIKEKDIQRLLEEPQVLQCSGGFSIEGLGGSFVKRIEGNYDSVIGLPLYIVREVLEKWGVM